MNIVDIFESCFPLHVDTSDGVSTASVTAWKWEDAMRMVHARMHGVGNERRRRIAIRHVRWGDVLEVKKENGDWGEGAFNEEAIEVLKVWYP